MIAIDTDVLSIYHIFRRDVRYASTALFMQRSAQFPRAIPIFSLLELCGIVAIGGQPGEAKRLFDEYHSADVDIIYPPVTLKSLAEFWANQNAELLSRIKRGLRFGDAAILWVVEASNALVRDGLKEANRDDRKGHTC
jgi:hypothetical protein